MTILLVGDVMLGRLVNVTLREEPPEYPWGDVLPLFEQADIRICNLECVVADGGRPVPKAFTFRSDARNVATLKAARIDAVSLANNHVLDYGPEALREMLSILDRAGIAHAGAGASMEEARRPASLRAAAGSVGVLSITDNEPGWEATAGRAGIWYTAMDPESPRGATVLAAVRAARQAFDIVIVAVHWGSNWGRSPEPGQRELGRSLVDAGADIVFGHSCHVFRGIEVHDGKPILYGAGDFVDDYAIDPKERNDESLAFRVELSAGKITGLRMHPTLIRGCQARLATGARGEAIAARMKSLCGPLGTTVEWHEATQALRATIP